MRRRSSVPETDDFYGPGSDLVLCILTMAILLLILIGISVRPEPPTRAPKDQFEAEKILREERVASRKARLQANEEMGKLLQERRNLKSENEKLDARIKEAEAQLQTMKKAARTVSRQLPDVQYVVLRPSGRRSPYERNGYTLSPTGRQDLVAALIAQRDSIIASGANTLLIEGFASAEPDFGAEIVNTTDEGVPESLQRISRVYECAYLGMNGEDCTEHRSYDRNLDLGYRRARHVWDYLVRNEGMPRWCATVVAHGRNRSATLEKRVGLIAEEQDIVKWDDRWAAGSDGTRRVSAPLAADAPELVSERKVEIRAIDDPNSRCRPNDLKTALLRLRQR